MKLLTNLIFEPKGKHDPALAYSIKDTVMSADGSQVYFALQDVPAGTALDNEDYWKLQIDLHDTLVDMQKAAEAAKGAVSANVDQNLTETQKATARRNIGMDKVIESLSDPLEASGNPLVVKPVGGMPFESVVTEFSPKQEGSGDPYPAGGGKNLIPFPYADGGVGTVKKHNGITYTVLENGAIDITGTASGDSYFILQRNASYGNENFGAVSLQNGVTNGVYAISYRLFYNAGNQMVSMNILSGTSVSERVYPQVELGTVATEWQPYENIRPLSGWDKLELHAAGKNLLDVVAQSEERSGVMYTVNPDGSITANGTATANSTFYVHRNYQFKAGFNYTLSGCPVGGGTSTYIVYAQEPETFDKGSGAAFSFNEDITKNVRILIYAGVKVENLVFKPMLRITSASDATYEPCTNTLHTLQIGQTVYGGKIYWLPGKGVIEWGCRAFDGTESWGYSSRDANPCFTIDLKTSDHKHAYSSHYKFKHAPYAYEGESGTFGWESSGQVLHIASAQHATVDAWKAFLAAQYAAGTPVQISYKLAEPVEIQFEPHEIIALPGVNTLYGDGIITVTGRQPQTNDLETRLAALEAAMTNV